MPLDCRDPHATHVRERVKPVLVRTLCLILASRQRMFRRQHFAPWPVRDAPWHLLGAFCSPLAVRANAALVSRRSMQVLLTSTLQLQRTKKSLSDYALGVGGPYRP